MTNADDVMITPAKVVARLGLEGHAFKRLVLGDEIRDFGISDGGLAFFPYDKDFDLRPLTAIPFAMRR